jgi:tetratricopeptide (TPR) repeat protein
MKRTILAGIFAVAAVAAGASSLWAQKQPVPKSQKELDAVKALMAAAQAGPDQTIAAAEALITGFADTEFKEAALFFEASSYKQKNDLVKAQVYGERVLEINPKNVQTTLMLGEVIVQGIRENDLDKEEKLAKAEKYLKDTIENLKTTAKPNSQTPDKDWEEAKQQMAAEAHNGLGLCALSRKKFDVAAAEFKVASDMDPQPAYLVRQASALQSLGKNDEAIVICDKVLADPQLHPQIKQVAQGIRAGAIKAGGKAPDGK